MKLSLLAIGGIVCLFLFLRLANAAPCDDYLTLFKLSSEGNAHVGLWNSSYTEEICLGDYFVVPSDVSDEDDLEDAMDIDELREADSENVILRVYSESNSHARIANATDYPIKVAFGDLVCVVKDFSEPCEELSRGENHFGKKIVTLRDYYNSHGSRAPSEGYNLKICCASENLESLENENECNNGVLEWDETCDGNNLNGASCPVGYIGNPTCAEDCMSISLDSCTPESLVPPFCIAYGVVGNEHRIIINGILTGPTSCDDYNDIILSDVNSSYINNGGNLSDYKQQMCDDCANTFITSYLDAYLPQDGINPSCGWDEGECMLNYDSAGGPCVIREVAGSDEGCEQGQAVKYVNITNSCDSQCNNPSTGGCRIQVPCAQVVQLPFFDYRNLIVAIIIIGLIYLVYKRKRK